MSGPVAPKDPEKKRKGFYIMRNKDIAGSPMPDGRGTQFIYLDSGRMINSAKLIGNIENQEILQLLTNTEGFRKLVYSIGVTIECDDNNQVVDFVMQMYGHKDVYGSGTLIKMPVKADGMEYRINLHEVDWSDDDNIPGQIRFEFGKAGIVAKVSVKFYVRDGVEVPEEVEEEPADLSSPMYRELLKKSLVQRGNNARLKKALLKAQNGEDVIIAFIGGSITQGAGAIPINTQCYAYKTFAGLCKLAGKGTDENIHYIKAGVGGTPSELGMLRYDRDVLCEGTVKPDIVVVEFAVNDEGDETKGECYDSLVRKILSEENKPAVVLLFAVFADDFNLQDRLSVVGKAYDLPMVSTRDTVVEQFYKKPEEGRIVSKNQFFYDSFHPTNIGHTIMADGLLHLFEVVQAEPMDEDCLDIENTPAPKGGEFTHVKMFDKKVLKDKKITCLHSLQCGSFTACDTELQGVERNMDLSQTKEFPYNWMHKGSEDAGNEPFCMDIECTALLIIYKDSAANEVGCAEVLVDGQKVLTIDPHLIGWTHCNPLICFRGRKKKSYHVEVRMKSGDENKDFTILGWGYVE